MAVTIAGSALPATIQAFAERITMRGTDMPDGAYDDPAVQAAIANTRTATVEPDGHDVDDVDIENYRAEQERQATARRDVRHPADVTIERLQTHLIRWADLFTSRELAAVTLVIRALGAIERGER